MEGRAWNTNHRGRLWIHAGILNEMTVASKDVKIEEIREVENMYKLLYEKQNVKVEFPLNYPTSALLGKYWNESRMCLCQ